MTFKFNRRRWVCLLLSLGLLASAAVSAQSRSQSTVLLVLPRDEQNIEQALRDYLKKQNAPVHFESLRYSGKSDDAAALVAQIRRIKPALIYTYGTPTTLAVAGPYDSPTPEKYIRDIPVVFAEVTDPLASKVLARLDPPNGNVTGVSHVAPLSAQLNAIKSYRPFKTLGYITNPKESNSLVVREALGKLAAAQGFSIVDGTIPLDAAGNPEAQALPDVIKRIVEKKVDFLYIGPSTFLAFSNRDLVTKAALEAHLPTFCATESIVRQAQCLFGLFSNGPNVGRFAAFKIHQILFDGVPIAKVPAETLQRFSLLINMPVARALNLYPPLTLLNVAEAVPIGSNP